MCFLCGVETVREKFFFLVGHDLIKEKDILFQMCFLLNLINQPKSVSSEQASKIWHDKRF